MSAPEVSVLPIDAATELPPAAGGKALGLRHIVQAGLESPPAWAVLPGAAPGSVDALAARLAAAGVARVAVRSSAADEDGGSHSLAGVHETALGVEPARLREAVASVAASSLSPRARSYRAHLGLPPPAGPCAVVVQELLDPEWAGVAFGQGEGVLVEAVEGLGELAVGGDATPETIELSRRGAEWRVVRRWARRQDEALRGGPRGPERVPLRGARPALAEAVAVEIARGVATLERARGTPLDVEWAASGGRVSYLQARPQTRALPAELPAGETWTRANASETAPEVSSALSRAVGVPALDRLMHDLHRRIGMPFPPGLPLAAAVAGRIVFNEKALFHAAERLGMSRSWVKVIFGGPGPGANAYARPHLGRLLRHPGVLVRLSLFAAGAERRARAMIRRIEEAVGRAATPAAALDDAALLARIGDPWGTDDGHASLLAVTRVAFAFQQALAAGALALAAHPAPAALLARLLDPGLTSVSTRQLEELVELARGLRGWPGAAGFLGEVGPEHAAPEHWRAHLPAPLLAAVEGWLARYGHRGPWESDLAQPRYADDLRLLAAALRPLVHAGAEPEGATARRARREADAAAAWREVAALPGLLVRRRARAAARRLGPLMVVREELRSTMVRRLLVMRRDVLELGRRLLARGRLAAAEDVFELTLEELGRAAREPAFDAGAAVARERARVAAWRRLEVPTTFRSEEVASFARAGGSPARAGPSLRGTAVSPGEVIGPACILRTPRDEGRMRPGGILVAATTDPGWTPIFAQAAGIVVEVGGVLSHAATVAREYGLPCVSNVEGATRTLRDGDLVRVDGTHGVVEVVEPAT